jgi:hypothetical protein
MPVTPPPPGLTEDDYERIEAAVMETERGRWFLKEFARRVRETESERLLDAMARIERIVETAVRTPAPAPIAPVLPAATSPAALEAPGLTERVPSALMARIESFARNAPVLPSEVAAPSHVADPTAAFAPLAALTARERLEFFA